MSLDPKLMKKMNSKVKKHLFGEDPEDKAPKKTTKDYHALSKKSNNEKKKKKSQFEERSFAKVKETNEFITQKHVTELEENGYTVIEGVLPEEECEKGVEVFYNWIEDLGPGLTRDNFMLPENSGKLVMHVHGIVEYPPSGMSDPAVFLRSRQGPSTVFSELWGVERKDLITSLDRIQIGVPAKPTPALENKDEGEKMDVDGKKKKKKKSKKAREIPLWSHTDQDSRLRGLQCIQGFVTVKDVSDTGGSLFLLKGSHKYHDELFEKMDEIEDSKPHDKKNWVKLPAELDDWLIKEKGCEPTIVRPLKAGSMILWDSRLIHANVAPASPPEGSSPETLKEQVRFGSYICMLPRPWVEKAPRKQIVRKQEAFLAGRTTSHWPSVLVLFTDNIPHNNNQIKKEVLEKFKKKYLDGKERAKTAAKFLEDEFSENPARYEEVVRQLGFENVEDYKNKL